MKHQEIGLSKEQLISMYGKMLLIRFFEDKVYDIFTKRMITGTAHLCQGHEAVSVGVISNLTTKDWITCTYRGHGHCIAKGVDTKKIMAEILGRSTGCCRGKGGSMAITDFSVGALGSFAIVGAGLPVATGAALASWYKNSSQVAVSFFGDGAANIGAFHEALNFASILKLPVIFVCENNLYGEYTPIAQTTSVQNIADRAVSYSMPGLIVDGNDVLEVYSTAKKAIDAARAGKGPSLIECKTYRQKGHSKMDPAKYRPDEEVKRWLARDPLILFSNYLHSSNLIAQSEEEELKNIQTRIVEEAYQFAIDSPYPDPSEVLTDVYL